jgi:hypothetical protein
MPSGRDIAKHKPDEFHGCFIAREMTPHLHGFAYKAVETLDGVRRVNDLPMIG